MSSQNLTAPFYEKKHFSFRNSVKKVSFLLAYVLFHPNRSGADQHHPVGHSVPSHNLWPLMSLITPIDRMAESAGLGKTSEIIKSNLNDDRTVINLLRKMSH